MAGAVTDEPETLAPLTDDELSALAMAADPEPLLDAAAISFWDLTGTGAAPALPAWYMPSPLGAARALTGWRRSVVVLVIVSFLVITAFGLCNTYGQLHFG